ncbi:MAG: hypothetical protein COT88_00200 [Candidatus Colwellbacteria bacterium CG10_big_fil_rev_8_21_14_0_10_41_28]|uniref:Uncharacterized protein n=1 Tax=Candidatus Colwellbacteria bacterium CG10_big_fil_rev_8_21_14_0_10_41_28 TaxID=1974539 RepID=A0A2H0VJZ8_9BACT|nr:MAG: hypothetical protein COT88_00200 [Candidatus Colwellbacteria bacterium CG10_big_fil_rev_8_21_14_0_10_41_28]
MSKERFVIVQKPNWQLVVMSVGWLGKRLVDGIYGDILETIFYFGGIVWAYEEVARGANWFRRGLGIVVLSVLLYGIFININS